MSPVTRLIVILMLTLASCAGAFAQATTTATSTTTTAAEAANTTADDGEAPAGETTTAGEEEKADTRNPYEIRNMFTARLREQPSELAMILKLDPSLLSNDSFLAGYPEIASFVARYPQIRANPRFYLAEFALPARQGHVLDEIVELFAVFGGFLLAVFSVSWLIRTLIEQKRWKQLSKTQTEVHNKILDRFNTSEQLLDYIKTPAGTKFLESAPIPLHAERPSARSMPGTRIMWSIQFGTILTIAGLGMLLVSLRFEGETSEGFFALGAIGLCVGAGFIASAVVSLMLSRRLGLWKQTIPPGELDEADGVR